MNIKDIRSFEDLVLLQCAAERDGEVLGVLRRNGLVRGVAPRCCAERTTEQILNRDRQFGKTWRCRKCKRTQHILKGSCFQGSSLRPFVILKIAFLYVQKLNETQIRAMIQSAPTTAPMAVWVQFVRDVMSKDLISDLRGKKIGGPGKAVVVGKTVLSRPKHDDSGRSAGRERCWLLGIYDVEGRVGTLEFVAAKSHDEVISKIQAQVELGSTVCTDDDEAYSVLGNVGYEHEVITHRENFTAPHGTRKNFILGYFSRVKAFLKRRNFKKWDAIASYLDEFMWMERHRVEPWRDFVEALQRQHSFQ